MMRIATALALILTLGAVSGFAQESGVAILDDVSGTINAPIQQQVNTDAFDLETMRFFSNYFASLVSMGADTEVLKMYAGMVKHLTGGTTHLGSAWLFSNYFTSLVDMEMDAGVLKAYTDMVKRMTDGTTNLEMAASFSDSFLSLVSMGADADALEVYTDTVTHLTW